MKVGDLLDQQGLLVRSGGGFVLQSDVGTRFELELSRMPVDLVEKRVRVVGRCSEHGRIEVEAIAAASAHSH